MNVVRRPFALLTLLFALLGVAAQAAEVAIPPSPTRWATDTANFLAPQTVAELDARLEAYETHTGRQILVYVAPTTGTTPTEDWTVRTFARWKVGRKGMDDGLVLFVFPKDHKVRIEVGYGLEQTIPDATAARIIRDTISPKLHAGESDAAVVAGVDAILGTFGDETASAPAGTSVTSGTSGTVSGSANDDDGPPPWSIVLGVVIAIVVIGIVMYLIGLLPRGSSYISRGSSGFGVWDAVSLIGGSILGGGGGGGGGFSGGGGMSGGGGATGSW